MAEPENIAEAIEQNAKNGVSSTSADGVSVTYHDIEKQIKADQYVKGQTAKGKNGLGLFFSKIIPPGGG